MDKAKEAIMKPSDDNLDLPIVKGYDFNQGIDYTEIIKSYATTGLQATNLYRAIETVNSMVKYT